MIVDNCTFENNIAKNGGAIIVECSYLYQCSNTIQNSYFMNNTALETGGAIKYNSYKPDFIKNTYINNTAEFGPNIASYAALVEQLYEDNHFEKIQELSNVPSGIVIDQNITLVIVNSEEDSVMTNDYLSTIQFVPIDNDTEVKGHSTVTVNSGVGNFEGIEFIAAPGRSNVHYLIKSSAINYGIVQHIDPVKYAEQIISVNFRWCEPGEIQRGNIWSLWSVGSYSTMWNSTECYICPDKAYWEGKIISLNKGYWRSDLNSTEIIEWPNEDAWLGGFNETNEYPINCAEGYKGLLCNECITEGDVKYERISDNTCSKCPDPMFNIIRIVGFSLLIIIFLIILIM